MKVKAIVAACGLLSVLFVVSTPLVPYFVPGHLFLRVDAQSEQPVAATPTYWVRINPGATNDAQEHYVPPHVAVPSGTTIQWVHNDLGQVHSVTSGLPGDTDTGELFDSGNMRFGATYQLTFDNASGLVGDLPYYCVVLLTCQRTTEHCWSLLPTR
jgi:plastocyanin